MKKSISIVILFMATGTLFPSRAQDRIGFFGGLNFATLQESPGREGFSLSRRVGLSAGTFYESAWTRVLGLRCESRYVKKGVGMRNPASVPTSRNRMEVESSLDFTYVEAALLLKVSVASDIASPYVFAGPTVSYLFSVKSSQALQEHEEFKAEKQDLTSRYHNFDFGVSAGAGFRFREFFLEGRYGLGLRNTARDARSEATHRGWQIVAGVAAAI